MSKAQVIEFKDKDGENRVRQIASNGKITDSSTEGYKNLRDAVQNRINASIYYIQHYQDDLTEEQFQKVVEVVNNRME